MWYSILLINYQVGVAQIGWCCLCAPYVFDFVEETNANGLTPCWKWTPGSTMGANAHVTPD